MVSAQLLPLYLLYKPFVSVLAAKVLKCMAGVTGKRHSDIVNSLNTDQCHYKQLFVCVFRVYTVDIMCKPWH